MRKILVNFPLLVMAIFLIGCNDNPEPGMDRDPFEQSYTLSMDFVNSDGEHLVRKLIDKVAVERPEYTIDVDCETWMKGLWVDTVRWGANGPTLDIVVYSYLGNKASSIVVALVSPALFGDSREHLISSEWIDGEPGEAAECIRMDIDGVEHNIAKVYEHSARYNHVTVVVADKK